MSNLGTEVELIGGPLDGQTRHHNGGTSAFIPFLNDDNGVSHCHEYKITQQLVEIVDGKPVIRKFMAEYVSHETNKEK